jgi:hypothetical protein
MHPEEVAAFHACFGLPGRISSDRLSPKNKLSIYSGGTVRESNPIILFSCRGSSPRQPRNGYSIVPIIVAQGGAVVNDPIGLHNSFNNIKFL